MAAFSFRPLFEAGSQLAPALFLCLDMDYDFSPSSQFAPLRYRDNVSLVDPLPIGRGPATTTAQTVFSTPYGPDGGLPESALGEIKPPSAAVLEVIMA